MSPLKSAQNVAIAISTHRFWIKSMFKRNAKDFLEQVKSSKAPLVLTVNGKAEIVVQDAMAFQELNDRLQQAEEELCQLKPVTLQQDIAIGTKQIKDDEYTEYDDTTLPTLLETIKAKGRQNTHKQTI
jgi:prevent-host-death family protein